MNFQIGFGDEQSRLARLSDIGDPLEKLAAAVDFELFRPLLDEMFSNPSRTHRSGRPSWDYVLMFKILILRQLYNIADDNMEYLINDRLSFQRFLGLSLGSRVPDSKTIWLYKDKFAQSGKSKAVFDMFTEVLLSKGIISREGSIVDASFCDAPRQRNTRQENETIREGTVPEEWLAEDPKSKHKFAQKDIDARWAKKNEETHYGYKDHVKIDKDSKLILNYVVTDAAVHDSKKIVELADESDKVLYADSAYVGVELHEQIREKCPNVDLRIHEKGYRNKPLSPQQKSSNTAKSRVRCRVEHVFGHIQTSMGGPLVRCIGMVRATAEIGLKNLAYNIYRYAYLVFAQAAHST